MKRSPKRPRLIHVAMASVAAGDVTSAVFELPGKPSKAHPWMAAALSATAMGLLAVWVRSLPPRPRVAPERHQELVVELFAAPPPAPPPAVEPPPKAPPPPRAARAEAPLPRAPTAEPQAPAPAQAAEVVAQQAPPDEALDLTSFTVATGSASQYAGGKTSSSGTSTRAVTGAVAPDGVANGTGNAVSDLSQPVRLREDEWDCPWPAEADALGIDEQTVVLRVMVRADGSVESTHAVQDPGSGFGAAAMACASRTRFEAARDRGGNSVNARSGPIRVRFTR